MYFTSCFFAIYCMYAYVKVMDLSNMRSVYECLRKPSAGRPLSVALLCDFSVQIADAMAYLENRKIVHRDLAARNVLLFASDKVRRLLVCVIANVSREFV